jgi:hypothetical protein
MKVERLGAARRPFRRIGRNGRNQRMWEGRASNPVLPLGAGSDARDGFRGYRHSRERCTQTGKAFPRRGKRLRSPTSLTAGVDVKGSLRIAALNASTERRSGPTVKARSPPDAEVRCFYRTDPPPPKNIDARARLTDTGILPMIGRRGANLGEAPMPIRSSIRSTAGRGRLFDSVIRYGRRYAGHPH